MSFDLSSINVLDEKGVQYSIKEFSPDTEKGAINVAKQFKDDPHHYLKTLIFKGESGKLYLCLVGGDQIIETNLLATATNEKSIEMADPTEIHDFLGFKIGSIPPFGLKNEIEVLVEESLRNEKVFGVGAGHWGVEIFIKPQDLIAITGGKYHDLVKKSAKVDWEALKLDKHFGTHIKSATDLKPSEQLKEVKNHVGKEVRYNGWVYKLRSSGKIMFLQFRDGSGDIQGIIEKSKVSESVWNDAKKLTIESSLQLAGKIKEDSRSPYGYEMEITDIQLIQISPEFPISKKDHGPDFLMDNRHIWLRTKKQRAALKIRDEVFFSLTSFLREEDFVRIDTPIFQPVSCEDTSELFEVDYFGNKTYLTQSGQLYCEAAEMGLGRTYDFGPVFRAEKSKTRKHLIEFWMMDAELPFTDLDGMMDFEEAMMKRIISDCLKNCSTELDVLERDKSILQHYVDTKFIRQTHKETIEMLNDKYNMGLNYLDDIGAPEEEKLAQIYDVPVFISDWPAEIKAFYMTKAPKTEGDLQRVRAVDLVAPEGGGELCGGSERIFDYNELLDVLKKHNYPYQDYAWYMDLRKYGTIPHSGFGIGLERTVRWISGVKHIRESIPFPRMLNRLYP